MKKKRRDNGATASRIAISGAEMQAEQQCQQPWELKIQAKANHFDFRVKAAIKHLPLARDLSRFSIRLKLSRFFIKFKGKTKAPSCKKLNFFKSKFRKILEMFRIRHGTRKAIPATANEGSAWRSPSTVGNLAHLWQWISGNDGRGILVLKGTVLPYLASVFKNLVSRKMAILSLVLFLAAQFCCTIIMIREHF